MLCSLFLLFLLFFFFKQKTAYEMRISDWSSDVCSSDQLAKDAKRYQSGDLHAADMASVGQCNPDGLSFVVLARLVQRGIKELAGTIGEPVDHPIIRNDDVLHIEAVHDNTDAAEALLSQRLVGR